MGQRAFEAKKSRQFTTIRPRARSVAPDAEADAEVRAAVDGLDALESEAVGHRLAVEGDGPAQVERAQVDVFRGATRRQGEQDVVVGAGAGGDHRRVLAD